MRKCKFESLEMRTLLSITPNVILHDIDTAVVHEADMVVVTDNPNHGTLDSISNNALQYNADTPSANDFFALQWESGDKMNVNVVAVGETEPSVAVEDTYTLQEDGSFVPVMPDEGILANDTINGANPVINLIGDVTHGDLLLDDDGSFIYLPDPDFNGSDTFVYDVTTDEGSTNLAFVTFDVTAINDAPDAVDDFYTGIQEEDIVDNVLSNDTDIDGDILIVSKLTDPLNGAVVIGADGDFTYTPNIGWFGVDSFTYQADDGNGGIASATVSLEVIQNRSPDAVDDLFSINEDSALIADVFSNDSDPDNDVLVFAKLTDPSNGGLSFNNDGTFVYTPNANWNGQDSFTYQADDGKGGIASATVIIDVISVNDPVDVSDDTYDVVQNRTFKVKAIDGVFANDIDVDGDPMTVTVLDQPANGHLVMKKDGGFIFRPDRNFVGSDSFTYTVNDGTEDSAVATVTLSVGISNLPVARPNLYQFPTGELGNIHQVSSEEGVLRNDYFVAPGDIDIRDVSVIVVDAPSHGTVNMLNDGSFEYVLTETFSGVDSFTYKVRDESLAVDSDHVIVTILVSNTAVGSLQQESPIGKDIAALDAYLAQQESPIGKDIAALDDYLDSNVDDIVEEIIHSDLDQAARDEYFSQLAWVFSTKKKSTIKPVEYISYYDYIQSLYEIR